MLAVKIIFTGWIDDQWTEWLGGLEISRAKSDHTILTGILPDQAAVYGILARMRDLGLELSSITIEEINKKTSYN